MADLEEKVESWLGKIEKALFGEARFCDLSTMIKFQMEDVQLLPDYRHLKHGEDLSYLIVTYQGHHVATAFVSHLARRTLSFPNEHDQQKVEKLYRFLESYYS